MNANIMTEQYWANTQLSFVRHTGKCCIDGYDYVIVDKRGMTFSNVPLKRLKPDAKRRLNPGNRAIYAGLISCRFTGNWAGKNSCNSYRKTRTCIQ